MRAHDPDTGRDRCAVDVRLVFVYILASKTRVLYVGVTNDLIRRLWEHRTVAVPGFTRRYGVHELVYYEFSAEPARAIAREKQIKGWARVKKVALIESMNPDWKDFAELWFVDVSSDDPSPSLGVTPGSGAKSSGDTQSRGASPPPRLGVTHTAAHLLPLPPSRLRPTPAETRLPLRSAAPPLRPDVPPTRRSPRSRR